MRFTEFSDLEIGPFHDKKITLSSGGRPVKFQIPRMYMPFGMSSFADTNRWNIDFSLKGYDEEGNYVKRFYDFIRGLEDKVVRHVHERAVEIFGKELSLPDIQKMFLSNLKESDGREPKFRVKVDTDASGTIKADVFDVDDNSITENLEVGLYSKKTGVALVELSSVYFMNKQIGLVWRLVQLKVYEPQRLKGFQFLTSSSCS